MNKYTIDHANSTIICSRAFYKAATQFGTPECKECQKLRKTFPDYTLAPRTIKTNSLKRTDGKNLTYVVMVGYIASQPNAVDNLTEFFTMRGLANQKGLSYMAVKKWFRTTFPDYFSTDISKQEKENVGRFISADTARKILQEASACETPDEVQKVLAERFTVKEVAPKKEIASASVASGKVA